MNVDLKIQWFLNRYKCEQCSFVWDDEWSCMCNDRCPECDIEMTPYASLDLGREPNEEEIEFASRRLPLPLWLPDAVELIQDRFEN